MTTFLRNILPVSTPKNGDDGDGYNPEYSAEYSFAMEYSGPPVHDGIPRVVPVDVGRIPTAPVASSASMWSNLSIPVIQPIVKKSSKEFNLVSEAGSASYSALTSGEFDQGVLPKSRIIVDSSVVSASFEVVEPLPNILDGIGSSGTLGFSDSRDGSQELSGSSEIEDLNDDDEDGDLNEGELRRRGLASEISCCEGEDCGGESPCHTNERSIETSCDPESAYTVHEVTDYVSPEMIQRRLKNKADGKKGLCHRCGRKNRFTEKETCIVCGAKYCGNCVLRAMGSMPEGRKCITCIGCSIDESNRGTLGKCTWMLKRMLTESEVKQIMLYETSCEKNLLPPHLVYVNGRRLSHAELVQLQTCSNPPKKLRPGRYWYDKVSGFWGKEGQKPCQIISDQLEVGGDIKPNASNGKTGVMINYRVITKAELTLLQFAGIRCEGNPHYWMTKDGGCQEEGMNNVMGKIWNKPGIKLVCVALSLPTPPDCPNSSREEVNDPTSKVVPNYLEQKTLKKLLLVGYDKSGTSTIFKQARMSYNVPFTDDERQNFKLMIQSNLYSYLGILLEGREQFEEEFLMEMRKQQINQPGPSSGISARINEKNIYSLSPRLKRFSDWLLQVMIAGNLEVIFPAASREYAPLVEELWKERAFQATYNRRAELPLLPRAAHYFLDRAVEISRTDYEPSDTDILYAEGITLSNGLASMEFLLPKAAQDSFMDATEQKDTMLRYQLVRVHASSLGENCKWLEMFEDIDLVLYTVALTDYDQFSMDKNGVCTNKMLVSKKLFENVVTHPTFRDKDFLLILNKFDLLEEKIEHIPLTKCDWFHDFNPVISIHHNTCSSSTYTNPSLAQRASHYIAVKFKRFFQTLTGGRKLYVSMVTGLESDDVSKVLRYSTEILKWKAEKPTVAAQYSSSDSCMEASTAS
ncbi:hypothetical protein NMG60_11015358 [Bertholletia excelsa]